MTKPTPNWNIWLNMPTLTTHQAVCLSFGLDPSKVSAYDRQGKVWGWSAHHMFSAVKGFGDRRMLLVACHPGAISPVELARWAQAVKWNIPLPLAALAPVSAPVFEDAPNSVVESAIYSVIAAGEKVDDLKKELETAGCRFVWIDGDVLLHIQDGTVAGKFESLDNIYSAIVGLCESNERIGRLVKASNSGGGGARGCMIGSSALFSPSPASFDRPADTVPPLAAEVASKERKLPISAAIPPAAKFSLRKLKRVDVLSDAIFSVLKLAHDAGRPRPSTRQVMHSCKDAKPHDIIELTHNEIKFVNDDGEAEVAGAEAVQKRIKRMTDF